MEAPKRVLLINPPVYDFSAFDLWMKPLGLLYVAALLEAQGYQVALVDAMDRHHPAVRGRLPRVGERWRRFGCGGFYSEEVRKPSPFGQIPRRFKRFGLPRDTLRAEIRRRPRPDVIAVTSTMTYWYPGVFEAIALAKEAYPNVPVILGGIYATLCADHARTHSDADVVVTGPAEDGLVESIVHLLGGPAPRERVAWEELLPAYHLMPEMDSVSVLTSRGCPFRCTYCASRLLWKGVVHRAPQEVVEEIGLYVGRGISDIAFYDDALLLNAREHLLEILDLLDRRGLRARFHTPNGLHIRFITAEVAGAMKKANFVTLRLSLETASQARQRQSGGKVANEEMKQAVVHLRSAGFSQDQLDTYVMFGLPDQDLEEVADSIAFVHQIGARVKLVQFSPIPGTLEFERAAGRLPELRTEPLLHNKTAFHQIYGGADARIYQALKDAVNLLNAAHDAGHTLSDRRVAEVLRPFWRR